MAGLHRDKRSGIYTVQFYDATRTPKRKQASTGVRDIRSARRLHREWEATYAEGHYDPWTEPPPAPSAAPRASVRSFVMLTDARDAFLASRAHRAMNTRANYDRVTEWFAAHVGDNRPVTTLTTADVQCWIDSLDVKPVTRANYVRHLRAFFRHCVQQKLITTDLTEGVRLERVPRHFPKALRPDEIEAVATYAETHARDGRQRSSAWAAPFIRLGAETAMRRGELLALRWSDVDLSAVHITVRCTDAFTTKSGAERRIPLSARACAVLSELRNRPSATGYVFESGGRPIDGHTCSDIVVRFARKAGVPALTPHVLRHSCITWLIERGVPVPVVQRFAGHADIATTMRYCSVASDVYADQIRAALE